MINVKLQYGEHKELLTDKDLQSYTIDWLRFPLILAVVFIHDFGTRGLDLNILHQESFSLESAYNFIRIFGSTVASHFAVPTFFLFSGYLFFYNIKVWNRKVYRQKLQTRFTSLFVPYIIWNSIPILKAMIVKLHDILVNGEPLYDFWQCFMDEGGLHAFYDSYILEANYINWIGQNIPQTSPIVFPLWFIRDLLVVVLFTPILFYIIKKYKLIPIIVLGFCYFSQIFIPINGFSATCFFWFSFGAYFSINKINMVETIYKFRIPAYIISIITIFPLTWFKGREGILNNPYMQILFYLYIISAVISAISITVYLLKYRHIHVNIKLAKASFFIFLSHIFILSRLITLSEKIIPETNYFLQIISYLTRPIITVLVCLILYELLNKFIPRFLSILLGKRT